MTWKTAFGVSLILSVALVAQVAAETPDDGKGRYALSPVDGGVLRLDKETGAVSLCARKADAWTCDAVADRDKPVGDAARLEQENKDLKARIKSLEDEAAAANGALEPPTPKAQLPTEEEVDKALDYVENIFKKFRDRIRKYEGSPPSTDGDRRIEPDKGGKQL